MAMGIKQDRVFLANPELRAMWEDYVLCRTQEFITFRRPEKGGKERQVTIVWTSGLSVLPDTGGIRDQNYVTMRVFNAFLEGERQGQMRRLSR